MSGFNFTYSSRRDAGSRTGSDPRGIRDFAGFVVAHDERVNSIVARREPTNHKFLADVDAHLRS